MTPEPPPSPRRRRTGVVIGLTIAAVLAVVLALAAVLIQRGGVLSDDEIRSAVQTGIEAEAAEGFLVTGRLASTFSASKTQQRSVRLIRIPVGRAQVTVRLPATMTYGFSLDDFDADGIRFREDGTVEVVLPPLTVFSVEPELEDASVEIETTGVGRLTPALTEQAVERALRRVRPALRDQAEAHLRQSDQPRLNSARALRRVLAAPLDAAGVDLDDVRFRFVVAPGDTLDVGPDGTRRAVPAG